MRAALIAVLLIAACDDRGAARKERELDASTFHRMLECGRASAGSDSACDSFRNDARRIESIRIEAGKNTARYVITWSDRAERSVVHAEYPGKLLDEIQAAMIPYSAKPSE
jgi:hypothetical protein